MKIRFALFGGLALCLGVSSLAAGCSDDEDTKSSPTAEGGTSSGSSGTSGTSGTSGGDSSTVTTGTVSVTTNYAGVKTGPIILAVFATNPASGPPLARGAIESPTLPGTNKADLKVPPGDWFAAAFMIASDDTPMHRISPRPSDPYGVAAIKVVAGQPTEVTVVLEDRAVSDAGTDGG